MKLAPLPPDEKDRLLKLQSYGILDTGSDLKFDDITKAIAEICEVKIALVSLVDHDRQWFKSRYGLDVAETPRDISFCGHAILGDDIFIVEDARDDQRFCDNPLVLNEPSVRFYAGVPLITPDNFKIGTLCVIDSVSKKLSPTQIATLKAFAQSVVTLIELSYKKRALEKLNQHYEDIQSIVQAGAWELDVTTGTTEWSQQIYDIYQIPHGTPTNKVDGLSHYAPHERERLSQDITDCIQLKKPFDDVFEFYDAKGVKKWVRSVGRAIENEHGHVVKVIGTFQDVTHQVQKEKELELVLHNITEGYFDWHIRSDYEYISPRFWEILGYDPQSKRHSPEEWRSILHPDDVEKVMRAHTEHFNSKGLVPYDQEIRFKHSSGEYLWIRVSGKVVDWDVEGAPLRMVGTGIDVTKEKELTEKLRLSNEYLDLALEGANLGVWDWYLIDNRVQFNERWAKLRGANVQELKMDLSDWESRVHPDDLAAAYEAINNYLNGKTDYYEHIHRVKHKEGHWLYILGRGRYSSWDEQGKPTRFTGTDMDVTELMSNKHKLDLFFKKAPYGIAFCDLDGKFLEINQFFSTITGYTKDELNQLSYWDLTPKEYQEQEEIQLKILSEQGSYGPYRKEYIKKNGQIIPVKLNGFMIEDYDGIKGIWSVVEDVSAKVKLERENQHVLTQYRDANEKLEAIFKHSPVVFYDCQMNENWTMNFINSYVEEMTGYSPQEFINDAGISFANIIHPDDRSFVEESIQQATDRNESYSLYYRIVHQSGAIRWVWERGAKIAEHNTLIGVILDVTQSKKQEDMTRTLSETRSKFIEFSKDKKSFFEYLLNELIRITESEYGFLGEILGEDKGKYLKTFALTDISWSQETRDFFQQHAPQGLEFKNLETLFGEVIKTEKLLITNEAPHHPKAAGIPVGHPPLETFMGIPILYNGKIFAMVGLANKAPGYEMEDFLYLSPFIDLIGEMIQVLKLNDELEGQRRLALHNAKLASIGELAAGVGHEINNPLAIILGQLEMMKMQAEEKKMFDPFLETFYVKASKGVERITNIVKGLRSFARMDENEFVVFNLSELLSETIDMLMDIYRHEGIVITQNIQKDLFVDGSRGRLQQVLVNLLNNGRDALVGASRKVITVDASTSGEQIIVRIADTGTGVPEELREKIFEPFFTTKEVNKGTGIGLALASTIMKDHQGTLVLENKSQSGATFILSFPLQKKTIDIGETPLKSPVLQALPTNSNGVALVVDDEENLRELMVYILNQCHIKAIVAQNGAEALELFSEHKKQINLVISDINMPELGGLEFAGILRGLHRYRGGFYLVTGDINKTSSNLPEGVDGVINKPFKMEQFRAVLEKWFVGSIEKK